MADVRGNIFISHDMRDAVDSTGCPSQFLWARFVRTAKTVWFFHNFCFERRLSWTHCIIIKANFFLMFYVHDINCEITIRLWYERSFQLTGFVVSFESRDAGSSNASLVLVPLESRGRWTERPAQSIAQCNSLWSVNIRFILIRIDKPLASTSWHDIGVGILLVSSTRFSPSKALIKFQFSNHLRQRANWKWFFSNYTTFSFLFYKTWDQLSHGIRRFSVGWLCVMLPLIVAAKPFKLCTSTFYKFEPWQIEYNFFYGFAQHFADFFSLPCITCLYPINRLRREKFRLVCVM